MMNYRTLGDIINYAFVGLNLCLTSTAMRSQKDNLDPLWTTKGFCVVDNDINSTMIDTEVICCILLVASAVACHFWLASPTRKKMNPLLELKLESSVFANAAHGFGHLFVYLSPGPPPPITLEWDVMAIGNIIMLVCFWVAVIRTTLLSIQLDYKIAFVWAITILTVQYSVLKVPPELAFTFTQSIIFLVGSIDQLIMAHQRGKKQPAGGSSSSSQEEDFSYVAISLMYLPLMALFPLEFSQCSNTLAAFGGHTVYDAYVSALPFMLYAGVQHHYEESSEKKKTG